MPACPSACSNASTFDVTKAEYLKSASAARFTATAIARHRLRTVAVRAEVSAMPKPQFASTDATTSAVIAPSPQA